MLGKLMKYEFKACGRTFFPMYICILVLSAINGLFNNYDIFKLSENKLSFAIEDVQGILILVLFALFISLFVLTILLTIQRFKKNLLEDEGYLMFTLPVDTKSLILSKFLVALIFVFLSGIVAIAGFMLIGMISGGVSLSDIVEILNGNIFGNSISSSDIWKLIGLMITGLTITYSTFILTIYLSISVGQLPQFNKHRVAAGVIAFFIINAVVSIIQNFISEYIVESRMSAEITNALSVTFTKYDILSVVLDIIIVAIIFMATDWILNKKLNIE